MHRRVYGQMIRYRSSIGINTGILADTTSVTTTNSDESWFSPSFSPRVLDFPVSADDTDQEDSVVDAGSTITENSTWIFTPVCGINSDWDWLWCYSIGESSAAWGWWVGCQSEWSSLSLAASCYCFVGIFWFVCNTMIFNIVKSWWWPSSIASVISIWTWAVYELLLWQTDCCAFNFCRCFQNSSGWEGPAWSTGSLIFNFCNTSFDSPINLRVWVESLINCFFTVGFGVKIGVEEFLFGHGCELVDTHFVGLGWVSIVFVNDVNIFFEDDSSVFLFSLSQVSSKFSFPFIKGGVFVGLCWVQSCACDEGC